MRGIPCYQAGKQTDRILNIGGSPLSGGLIYSRARHAALFREAFSDAGILRIRQQPWDSRPVRYAHSMRRESRP